MDILSHFFDFEIEFYGEPYWKLHHFTDLHQKFYHFYQSKVENVSNFDKKERKYRKIAQNRPIFTIFSLKISVIFQITLDFPNINRFSIIFTHFIFISVQKYTDITTKSRQKSNVPLSPIIVKKGKKRKAKKFPITFLKKIPDNLSKIT